MATKLRGEPLLSLLHFKNTTNNQHKVNKINTFDFGEGMKDKV
jgi:hypothetical protein